MCVIAAYVVFVMSLVMGHVTGMDQAMKDHILKVHNDYRRNEGGSNIAKLEWDSGLEAEAAQWAAGCNFQHKGMGENLAWNSNLALGEEKLIDTAMKKFYDEKNRYSYGQHSCSMACHYTQLVWAKTKRVGCATKECTPLGNTGWGKTAWYLVCRYEPAGNMNGEKPYERGQCDDSKCGGGKCEDGLCVGGSEGGDDDGGAGGDTCEDKEAMCPEWARNHQCLQNQQYMRTACPLSCSICQPACSDSNPKCQEWADAGECNNNASYMNGACKKACGRC